MLDWLAGVDRDVLQAARSIAVEPVVSVAIALSWWWVKGPFMVALAFVGDLRAGRARRPVAAVATAVAWGLGAAASTLLKGVFDRARPDEGWPPLIATPSSASFPSGHATQAFAAATALALLVPWLRVPVLVLAALIAASRVVLGVHYPFDVIAGALVGAAIGTLVALVARRSAG
jgi:undecaprenyl-diphosphatase